jgi:YVTN family beta-propeller protein
MALLAGNRVIVATQGSKSVSALDAASLREVRRIPVGVTPHDVAASADGRRAFVLSPDGLLVVVDPASGRILQRVALRGRLHDLAVLDEDIWITDIASPVVTIMNAGTGAGTATVFLPRPGHDLAMRPGAREVWITPWSGNAVVIIDARTRASLVVVRVGRSPQHLAFTPDGREAWITETESGTLSVIDAAQRRTVATITIGGRPHHIAVDGRRAYVADGPSSVVVVDVRTRAVTGRIPVGLDPHDVVIQ